MNYEEIESTGVDGVIEKYILIDTGDGRFKSFPVNENNPDYIIFLAQLEGKTNSWKDKLFPQP
jgi:hypothetical protein